MTLSEASRNPVEELAEAFLQRRRQGENVSIQGFAEEHSHWAEQIRELFPTLLLLEDLRPGSADPLPSSGESSLPPTEPVFDRLGDFRILREIGRGGMGVVYEAEQQSLGRRVALKILPDVQLGSSTCVERFLREAQAAARLQHANIVPVYGVGREEGLHYIAMQYIEGESLDRILRRLAAQQAGAGQGSPRTPRQATGEGSPPRLHPEGAGGIASKPAGTDTGKICRDHTHAPADPAATPLALPRNQHYWRAVARIGVQVAAALEYAHRRGTLHRDVKPANLLMDSGGNVWITDFGLAKCDERDDVAGSGDVAGTLRYMAPEVFGGVSDARSDVYSLGLTLYELLTLRAAFDGTTHQRLLVQVSEERPPPPRTHNAEIPRDLETIVLKAIARDPARRYQTAADLGADLQRFVEKRPIRARRATPVDRFLRWCRRNPAVALLSGAATALLVSVAVVASIGYVKTTAALGRESEQRRMAEAAHRLAEARRLQTEAERRRSEAEFERAETNLRLAMAAFEDVFARVAFQPAPRFVDPETRQEQQDSEFIPVVTEKDAALLQGMLAFYDRFAAQNRADAGLPRETARAYRRVGDIQRRLGRFEEAESAYRHAAAVWEGLADNQSAGGDPRLEVASLTNEIGTTLRMAGRYSEAGAAHNHALALLEDGFSRAEASPQLRCELARTHDNLAYLYLLTKATTYRRAESEPSRSRPFGGRRSLGDHRDHGRQAVQLLEGLVEEDPGNPEYRVALARSYRNVTAAAWNGDLPPAALDADEKAIAILESLVRDFPAAADYRCELAETYAMINRRAKSTDARAEQEQRLRRAVEIAENLVAEHPAVPEYRASLADFHYRLATFLGNGKEAADKKRHLGRAVELLRSVIERFPTVRPYQMRLAWYRRSLAESQQLEGEHALARRVLEQSVQTLEAFFAKSAEDGFVRSTLATHYTALAAALSELGEQQLSEQAARKAAQLAESDQRSSREPAGRQSAGIAQDSPPSAAAAR